MDDLLSEFLTETVESLDVIDVELVKFEQEPNNADILSNIFRLVHTIKGTCGFLGLPRLEALAHASETLMGKFRDGAPVTGEAVTLILASIDRIKEILGELEETEQEPAGSDEDLISELEKMADVGAAAISGEVEAAAGDAAGDAPAMDDADAGDAAAIQVLEREVKPGEVSLDDLERAFQEAEGPEDMQPAAETPQAAEAPKAEETPPPPGKPAPAKPAAAKEPKAETGEKKEGGVKNQTIRVNVDTLEHLMTMVSELVLTRNQLLEIVRRHEDSEFKVPLQRLSNVTVELQEGVMKTRMQPIGNAWQKLPRIVRDLAQELDKKIELEMVGAETELDRQVLELIKDPLTHMVRNSGDHGLEGGEERLAAGKPEAGKIKLSAYHEGGHIIIEIADDGRGLNTEKIRAKAIDNGVATDAELDQMTENQLHRLIFAPGFSTATTVTSVSGRGVGMDVVRTNIELIGGSVELKSVEGQGSTFTIKIPLTLAIVSALIVEAAGQKFAIPQLSVVELVRVQTNSEHRIETIKDTPVLRLRNKLLPLINLSKLLGMKGADPFAEQAAPTRDKTSAKDAGGGPTEAADAEAAASEAARDAAGFIVVTQVGSQNFGIVVDAVFHTEEIVVKPMASKLRDIVMFSGNTILGDGSVIMIIDPNGIANSVGNEVADVEDVEEAEKAALTEDDSLVSFLVFRAGSDEPKAVPLSLVTRLEEVDVSKIERSNGRYMVQYRGSLMPLVFADPASTPPAEGTQPLLVFTEHERSMGLAVDEIIDIVEDQLKIQVESDAPGRLGSAVIKEHATEIIDVGYFLPQAFADWFAREEFEEDAFNQRVLLVDDSSFFRNMLAPVLKASGYQVTTVDSAVTALKMCEEGMMFDVIVSDIEMPEMNGFEFAEAVRNNTRWAHLPIVALSSHSSPAAIERGRQAGFHDYVAKFDREGLIETLRQSKVEFGEAA
jgi:two-component system chemotaxis sensor kinase CheA